MLPAGLGEAAARFEREEVLDGRPPEPRMQLSVDGTGVPMRKEGTEGVAGRQADGTSKTREARLAVICTVGGRDPGTGAAVRDRGGESVTCLTGGAAAPSGGREPSDFAARPDREARRRGLHDAGGPVVVSDGAERLPNACEGLFGGRDLAPSGDRHEDVEACCRHFESGLGRVRHDGFRERGVRAGSGVVEGGCRQFGLRTERSGTCRADRGANAMLALKALVMNLWLPDFLEWRANQAVAA